MDDNTSKYATVSDQAKSVVWLDKIGAKSHSQDVRCTTSMHQFEHGQSS